MRTLWSMHKGTAVLTSINNVKRGIAIKAEPKPEMPWIMPAKKKMNDIRMKVIIYNQYVYEQIQIIQYQTYYTTVMASARERGKIWS